MAVFECLLHHDLGDYTAGLLHVIAHAEPRTCFALAYKCLYKAKSVRE